MLSPHFAFLVVSFPRCTWMASWKPCRLGWPAAYELAYFTLHPPRAENISPHYFSASVAIFFFFFRPSALATMTLLLYSTTTLLLYFSITLLLCYSITLLL